MRKIAPLLLIAAAAIAGFVFTQRRKSPSRITRAEVISIAESYVTHEWTPAEANAFHGLDPNGIRVDTPDAKFQAEGDERGW